MNATDGIDVPGSDPVNAERVHPQLRALARRKVSGVYVIYERTKAARLLYVGESHSGRLGDTIARHFREWRLMDDPQGRRRGGTMYDRRSVRVAWWELSADQVQARQYDMIVKLKPRHNALDCHTCK
jgi:hypothetical protein